MNEQELVERAAQLAARPYTFTLVRDDDQGWTSGVLEIPGVISEGDDPTEAITMAEDALQAIIESLLDDGLEVPEPFETREFSGRLQLRLNPELHRRATALATQEGVSLNRWLSAAVARAGGAADAGSALAAIALASLTDEERITDLETRQPRLVQVLREAATNYSTDRTEGA
jgi:predicted RNase H-like HicB family nuclease